MCKHDGGLGHFFASSLIAAILASASVSAYLLCGALYFCIMLCYAELSTRISNSGKAYVFNELLPKYLSKSSQCATPYTAIITPGAISLV
ncbi:MAG: hypothetical protein ABW174_02320 [Flavitalea sp.]